jgi:CHAT domain-containing protein
MALKSAVKAVNNPRVLHIATHGMFLEDVKRNRAQVFGFNGNKMIENPLLRSGLFFTGADNCLKTKEDKPTGAENDLLTAFEAMNLNLDKTELVVLSACETGLGEVQNGEGVFGLRRAFQTAGAKTVIMSLWAVNDKATRELMSSFYKNWIMGMTKRKAFNKAQQEIKEKYKDPYYWGAFVMVGE